MRKMLFSILIVSIISLSQQANVLYQHIWYDSYDEASNYHTIKQNIRNTNDFDYSAIEYLALINRSDELTNIDSKVLKDNNVDYDKYRFFLINLNGNHKKKRGYVLWDVTCSSEIVTYKIRFFTCDNEVKAFYDGLDTTHDKLFNYGTAISSDSSSLKSGSSFSSGSDIISYITSNGCN